MKRILRIIVMIIVLMMFCITVSYGSLGVGDLKGNQEEMTSLTNAGNDVVKVVSTIGIVVSVIVLIALGIKYMLGSVEERAEYKKTLLPYIIGAVLVFSASTIAQIVYDIAKKL